MRKIKIGPAARKQVIETIQPQGIPFPQFLSWQQQLEYDMDTGDTTPKIIGYGADRFWECTARVAYNTVAYRAIWDLDKAESNYELIEFHLVRIIFTAS